MYDCIYIHLVEYYSALKRKKILPHVTAWMNLENMILSEISRTQKDRHSVIMESKKVKLTEAESRMVIARGWGDRRTRRYQVSVIQNE